LRARFAGDSAGGSAGTGVARVPPVEPSGSGFAALVVRTCGAGFDFFST
jgi:hypothetical protein